MSEIPITTSQNVNINFNVASIGVRILAFILDWLIKLAYIIALGYILKNLFHMEKVMSNLDDWSVNAVYFILYLPVTSYTLVLESLMEGQTFGKKLMKIKAVKIDGYQAGFGDYFVRWIMNLVDIYMTFGIAGIISIIVSKYNQRLGDMVAGTGVISLKNEVNISHTILENLKEDYSPKFPQVIALNDNDMRIIKENYQKALKTNDIPIISKLSQKIQEILKFEYDRKEFTEKQFIDKIIKDYNYYTGKEN